MTALWISFAVVALAEMGDEECGPAPDGVFHELLGGGAWSAVADRHPAAK